MSSKRRLIAPVPIWMFPLPQGLLTAPRLWISKNFGTLGRVGRDYREIRWYLWILSESTGPRAGISESTWDWGQHTCHGITWDKGFLCIRRMCFTTAKWESADRCRKSCKGLSKHRGLLDTELSVELLGTPCILTNNDLEKAHSNVAAVRHLRHCLFSFLSLLIPPLEEQTHGKEGCV